MKRIPILIVAIVLAIGSFAYARHHYVGKNSVQLTNPFNRNQSTTVANPVMDSNLFGNWVKDELVFAVIVPVALLAGGVAMAFRR